MGIDFIEGIGFKKKKIIMLVQFWIFKFSLKTS